MIAASHDTERNHILHLMDAPPPVSIPSTAAGYTQPVHLTAAELRERRARAAGLTIVACPLCGEQATQEVLLATRPGQGTVRRTVVRCLRQDNTPRCPVSVSEGATSDPGRPDHHPDQQNATEARPGPKEEHMPERTCATCGADISKRGWRAVRCETCSAEHNKRNMREWWAKNKGAGTRADGGPESSAPAPASPPVSAEPESTGFDGGPVVDQAPLALRVSVLDLAQRLAQGPEVRAVVRAVLALSPERQDLLRRLLEDEEVAA